MKTNLLNQRLCAVGAIVSLAALLGCAVGRPGAFLTKPPEHGIAFVIETSAATARSGTNELAALKDALGKRCERFGLSAYWKTVSGRRARVVVAARGGEEVQLADDALFRSGKLEFLLVHGESAALVERGEVPPGYQMMPHAEALPDGRKIDEQLLVKQQPEAGLGGSVIQSAAAGQGNLNQPDIEFRLRPEAAAAFAKVTRENLGRRLAIVVDGKLLSAPVIRSEIATGSGQISGVFTRAQARDLADALESPLPVPVKVVESKAF